MIMHRQQGIVLRQPTCMQAVSVLKARLIHRIMSNQVVQMVAAAVVRQCRRAEMQVRAGCRMHRLCGSLHVCNWL